MNITARDLFHASWPAAAGVLSPVVFAALMLGDWMWTATRPARIPPAPEAEAPPVDLPTRRAAVVVTGNGGAELSDLLIPYEVLAATGAFDLRVVAPERALIPLASAASRDGGLDLLPHLSIDDYDRTIGRAPALIVIPYLPAFASGAEDRLVPWIRAQAERGALVVSICAGAEVLAATGLVAGKKATTHPSFIAKLEREHPETRWIRDVRWVETDVAISSGAIASGMDATLAAVRRLLGRQVAAATAAKLRYPHTRFLDDPRYAASFDVGGLAKALFDPRRRTEAVLLYEGVGEVALASIFDTYATAGTTRLVSLGEVRRVLRTAHDLWLVPRTDASSIGAIDRVIIPGIAILPEVEAIARTVADARGREVTWVHARSSGFAYDAPLADIAQRDSQMVARGVAVSLNYPVEHLVLPGPVLPMTLVVVPVLLGLAGALLGLGWARSREARAHGAVRGGGAPARGPAGGARTRAIAR